MKNKLLLPLFALTLIFSGCTKSKTTAAAALHQPEYPSRIVSLSPAATEILFAVGAQKQIAARSDFCDYPEEALELPSAGGFAGQSVSLESILSFNPDLVYLTDGIHNFLIPMLQNLNIPYYLSTSQSIQEVLTEIQTIGEITGHKEQGRKISENIQQQLNLALKKNEGKKKTVYWEIWDNPLMSAGSKTFINDLITAAGGENIFGGLSQAYMTVSEESIIAANPAVILIAASSGNSADIINKRTGWENISAVLNHRIFIIDDNLLTRPGPRVGQAVLYLQELLSRN